MLERRKYKVRQLAFETGAKYFKSLENKETLSSKDKFDKNAPTVIKEYTYTTGAVYNGEWKGGLRHGKGTMKWPDAASYEGEW